MGKAMKRMETPARLRPSMLIGAMRSRAVRPDQRILDEPARAASFYTIVLFPLPADG
jgi:hypothetical protein